MNNNTAKQQIMDRAIKMEINHSDYTILIVDDVVPNTLLLKALLKKEKYNTITANNGYEAIAMVENESPDLILLDVMMPGMSGFEVSQQLKANPEYRDIPIIFLTALNSPEDIVKGFQLGANDFITKPFNKDELNIRISHQISLIAAKRIILKRTEELRNAILGRDKLYSVIAHDLRGPLGSIKMILNLLTSNVSSRDIGEQLLEMLNMANHTTEEVFTLLDNLLKWTKSQIGRLNVVRQQFDLVGVLRDGMDISAAVAVMKQVKLDFKVDCATMEVCADIDMAKTVLRNLLSNAIKFSNAGDTVTVELSQNDDFATISIIDTGCGIKESDKLRLLIPETHFSTFGTDNEEGSGLGLLLCKDFATKNGGNLWFDSIEGKGSTFSFSLPKH